MKLLILHDTGRVTFSSYYIGRVVYTVCLYDMIKFYIQGPYEFLCISLLKLSDMTVLCHTLYDLYYVKICFTFNEYLDKL